MCIYIYMRVYMILYWRKFRSQTSDNIDRWKSRGEKSQRRESVRGKKMQVREKVVAKSRNLWLRRVESRLAKAAGAIWMRWKVARRCGAKHISKSKCAKLIARLMRPAISLSSKHTNLGPLLEGEMSKKCTPLWREAHLKVKMYKAHQPQTTFGGSDVEKVHVVAAWTTFRSQKC